jgi:hypothetical protein
VATETETQEIVEKAAELHEVIEGWIGANFPALRR